MLNLAKPVLLGAALLAAAAAPVFAADYYEPPVVEVPPPVAYSAWYIRGHLGMSNQRLGDLDNVLFDGAADLVIRDKNFEAGVLFGGGVGYEVNQWLRLDITGEYRGETGFHGLDTWTDAAGVARFNDYTAKKSEWLFLANAYADLGEWYGIAPYVGAGIGASRNTIHSFRDRGFDPVTNRPTLAYADSASEWNLAWALHAGLGYRVNDAVTIDFGYSFVNLGDASSGDVIAYDGTNNVDNPMRFKDITSHDFKLGVRYAFH